MTQTISNPFASMFDFGPVSEDIIRVSMEGIAVRRKDSFFVYDTTANTIKEVFDFMTVNLNMPIAWKIPVKVEKLAVGDMIVYQNVPYYVVKLLDSEKNTIRAFNMNSHSNCSLNIASNQLNMRLVSKVVSFAGNIGGGDVESMLPIMMMVSGQQPQNGQANPMAALLPMMLLKNDATDVESMLPILAMMNGMQSGQDPMAAMMPMLMMGGDTFGDMDDMLPMLMMSGMMGQNGQNGQANPMAAMMPLMMMRKLKK